MAQNVTAGYVTVASSCTGLTFTAHLYEPSQTTPAGRDLVFEGVSIDVQTVFPPVRLSPGRFAFQYAYATPSRADFSQTIPFTAFGLPADVCATGSATCGTQLGILFHLKIRETLSNGSQLTQTGWAGDGKYTGKSWGYYIGFTPCCTCQTTPAPALASNCDGSLHYSVDGATCHWTFESGGAVIGSSDSCAGDLTVSLPAGSDVDATVHVVTAEGCTGDASTSATTIVPLEAEIISENLTCEEGSTGTATAAATGGTGPYTFAWSNGATTETISGVAPGDYTVSIQDANACTAEASVTLTGRVPLSVEVSSDAVACGGGTTGGASAIPAGGVEPYSYLWSNGETTPTLTGVAAGEYGLTVTDASGCIANASVTITQPAPLGVEITSGNVACFGGATATATAVPSGGVGPYTFLWSNGATGASLDGVPAGDYGVTVTDANGCPATASVTITQPGQLGVEITSEAVACFDGASGRATAVPSGGIGPYTFLWSNGATGASISGVPAGSYNVTVADANGCPATASVTINEPPVLAVSITSDNVECSGGASGNVTAVPTGGTGPFTFLWSNGATGDSLSGVPAGEYSVTVTDAKGCPATASVTITQPPALAVEISSDAVACFGGASGSASAVPSGGVGPYTFLWSNGATGASLDGVPAGD
ncbi:MAG TPA: SprB repeat-containing protein, partial [Nocardioides sp.]